MNRRILLFSFNLFSIMMAFLLGYLYEKDLHTRKLNEEASKKYYIDIKQTKDKFEINNPYPNIRIRVNGESLTESGIVTSK